MRSAHDVDYSWFLLKLAFSLNWKFVFNHIISFLEDFFFFFKFKFFVETPPAPKTSSNKKSTKKIKSLRNILIWNISRTIWAQGSVAKPWKTESDRSWGPKLKFPPPSFFSEIFLHPLAGHLISLFMGGPAAGYLLPSNTPQWQARFFHHRPAVKF